MRWIALVLTAAAALAACSEKLVAPGQCPDYCPDTLSVRDVVLRDSVHRDTAFRGYLRPHDALLVRALLLVERPGLQSRAIAKTATLAPIRFSSDTMIPPAAIVAVDSLRLQLVTQGLDTLPRRNLVIHLYRIPKTIDSNTTFADVAPSFADSLVRSVNLDTLLSRPVVHDSVLNVDIRLDSLTGDYVRVDTVARRLTLSLKLDSAHAPYVAADTGRLAFGVRVSADSLARLALVRFNMVATWYTQLDSLGADTVPRLRVAPTDFDSFVFDPPPLPLDSTLAVGGIPTARSILRVGLPRAIRDSSQIIRATLILVPDRAADGFPSDSFLVVARRVQSDLGAKSVLADDRDSSNVALAWVHIGSTDTVTIEVTRMLRVWAADTAQAPTFMLQQSASPVFITEGESFAEIRFRPSGDAAFRPALHLTYIPRYRFTIP